MTDANVERLIEALAADLTPVSPPRRLSLRIARAIGLGALVIAAGAVVFGIRNDAATMATRGFLVPAAALVAAAIVSATAALRASIPGDDRAGVRAVAIVAFALWPATWLAQWFAAGGRAVELFAEPLHVACGAQIVALAIAPVVAFGVVARRGVSLQPVWAGVMAGMCAAGVGALGVSLTCPVTHQPHLLVSHALPALIVAIVAAGLVAVSGRRRLGRLAPWTLSLIACVLMGTTIAAQGLEGSQAAPAFVVDGTTFGYVASRPFIEFLSTAGDGVAPATLFDGRGPLLVGAAIFGGGLLLNLTPCVLPMIPINLAIIGAGRTATSRRRGWLLGGTYGAAIAITYGLLGAVIVATAGTFGVLNASPWFNAAIAVLFVVLGLSMFDLVHIDFSRFSTRVGIDGERRGSLGLAFVMGSVAALLAGACVAPVVIQVITLSSRLYAGGSWLALLLPFVLGAGMGAPWAAAGAGLAVLPRPGAWMVRVKQGLGVCILATAVYYGWEAVQIARPAQPAAGLAADGWYDSLDEGLAAARRDGKPVFLDVWATWCKNCVVMNATTFKDPDVIAALDGFVKVRVQAEDVERPDVSALLDRLDSVGLPTYAVLRPGSDHQGPAPHGPADRPRF